MSERGIRGREVKVKIRTMFIICLRKGFFYDENWTRDGAVTTSTLTHSDINDSEKEEEVAKIKATQGT